MIQTMVVLTPGPIVRALFRCILTIPVVMLVVGYGIFIPTGIDSKCDVFSFVLFVPIGVKSKGG